MLNAAIRINTIIMAVAFGLLCGAILWLSTAILLVRGGQDVGTHLSLLSVFFPGYSVTWSGAWIGLLWGFVCGALSGASSTGVTRGRCASVLAGRLLDSRCRQRAHAADIPVLRQRTRHRPGRVDGVAASAHDELAGRARHGAVQQTTPRC